MDGQRRQSEKSSQQPLVPWRKRGQRVSLWHPHLERTRLTGGIRGAESAMYRYLGAHPDKVDGIAGTRFAVWAPNAAEVSLICDQNGWQHGQNQLHPSDQGIWSGFVPEVGKGDAYKYSIRSKEGTVQQKADPVGFFAELPPKSASVVFELDGFPWNDHAWLREREQSDWLKKPISIYEVHLGSWRHPKDGRRYFTYRELAEQLVAYCQEMGFTHLQLLPVGEHPFDGSWGYQTTGYFAPTSRFGDPHDFMYFVDFCHQAGIGIYLDWVPGHFPTDGHSLGYFDGTCLYEHADPRQGYHPDWGTLIFNYSRNEVRDYLLASARFWLDVYHIDGLRVDAVASMLYLDYSREEGQWVPNPYGGRENIDAIEFLRQMNIQVHRDFPGTVTIAEESTSWGGVSRPVYDGGLGFTMKWDMGWMNDTLRYLRRDPIYRSHHQNDLSFRMMYAYSENFVLPLSHDEVVHGKRSLLSQMPGDYWQQFANLRMLYGYQYTLPGKKLLFMGCELGQWTEWNHNEEIDWALIGHEKHDGLRRFVGDLNQLYRSHPALHETDFVPEGFQWILCDDWQNSVVAFQRISSDQSDLLVVACNFTPVPRENYRLGVPQKGFYQEVLNSDAEIYGGSNLGNVGGMYSEKIPFHGREHSIGVNLPPLAIVVFRLVTSPPGNSSLK